MTDRQAPDKLKLEYIRDEIDVIDSELVRLLNSRMQLALAAGAIKLSLGMGVYDLHREDMVIERIRSLNSGPLSDDDLVAIYIGIMDNARRMQRAAYHSKSDDGQGRSSEMPQRLKRVGW